MEYPSDEEGGMLTIPFQFSGVISYFPFQKPAKVEWEDDLITKIELTAEDPVWDSTSSEFADQEDATMNYRGEVVTHGDTARGKFVINSIGTCDAADITDDANLGLALENKVAVPRVGV